METGFGVTNFLCVRVMAKEMALGSFCRGLFRLNGSNGHQNCFYNMYIDNCSFAREGPHRFLRLGMAQTRLIALHVEHGYAVIHKPTAALGRPLDCAAVVSCTACGVELYDTHTLLMVVNMRTNIICKLLQHANERLTSNGPVPLIHLLSSLENLQPENRSHLRRLLTEAHRPECAFRERLVYANVMDCFSTNRHVNSIIGHRCESCLNGMIERELLLEIAMDTRRRNIRAERKQIEIVNEENTTIDATCRCCFVERAQVNVPCGHLFECETCKVRGMEAAISSSDPSPLVSNPPCSVCRAPVYLSINLYD